MKILRFAETDTFQRRYTLSMSFDSDTGVLSGTLGTSGTAMGLASGDFVQDFSIDLNDWVGKLVEIWLLTTDTGYEILAVDTAKNCAIGNGMPDFQGRDAQLKLFRIAVRENIADSVIQITSPHEAIEGFEDIVSDEVPTLRMKALCENDDFAKAIIAKTRKKSEMQGKIDFKDSISYLEAQVDLLTRFILQNFSDASGDLVDALKLADAQSVLDIKAIEKVKEEFTDKKALVRKAQQDYFDAETSTETTAS